ncbi:MAG: 4Fe-4S dicluster domain-containing protein [Thermodesulfobacteriota bacterium]
MSDGQAYRDLIAWLNQTWWGLPDSPELLPLLQITYTPDEARLLRGLPFKGLPLGELAAMKNMDPAVLWPQMEALARKGLVFASQRDGEPRYGLNDSFFVLLRSAFWSGADDERTRQMAPKVNRYFRDSFFAQYADAHTRGLRAIPIQRTIADTRQVLPYEDVVQVIEGQDYLSVSHCPCRQRKNLDEDAHTCQHPTEVCLHFGRLGRYLDAYGLGRPVSQEEALGILTLSADSGLMHSVSNWQQGVDTICNCCACCCLFLEGFHALGHLRAHDPSNYLVSVNPATCKACGLCVERCPMDALSLEPHEQVTNQKGLAPQLKADLCLGCGVCVHKCPTSSLVLRHRSETMHPPQDGRDNVKRFLAEKAAVQQKRQAGGGQE